MGGSAHPPMEAAAAPRAPCRSHLLANVRTPVTDKHQDSAEIRQQSRWGRQNSEPYRYLYDFICKYDILWILIIVIIPTR